MSVFITTVFFLPLKLTLFHGISKMWMKNVLGAIILSALCLSSFVAQNTHFSAFGITSGLERPDVSCVFQDSRGLMWVGTSGAGLYRFVQSRFSQAGTPPDVTGYTIRQIGEDKSGFLYLLSELGLIRYDGRDFLSIGGHSNIKCFAINNSGVWWTTGDSLFLQKVSGNVLRKSVAADLLIPDIEKEDRLMVVSEKEITFIDDELQVKEEFSISGSPDHEWVSYTYDADSTLWIISHEGQLLQFNGFDFALMNTGLTDASCIATGALGSLWIAGSQGISIYQSQDSSLISLQLGGPAHCLYFDDIDRLWIGSPSEGLIRYFGDQHRQWDIPDDEDIQKIFPGETADSSLLLMRSGFITSLVGPAQQIPMPRTESKVRQIYQDKLSRLWTLTEKNLWMYHDTAWVFMDSSLVSQSAEIVGSDHLGNIWIADTSSLVRYGIKPVSYPIGISFAAEKVQGRLPPDKTLAVLTDRQGKVLRIGAQSVGHLTGNRYEQTHQIQGYNILCADLDAAGMLWYGTDGAGIFRTIPEHGHIPQPLKTTYPLRQSEIVFVRNTTNGVIAGTDRTILRIQTDTSGVRVIKVDILNEESGISMMHTGAGQFAVTNDGHVLVAAEGEVVEFELSHTGAFNDVPTVYLSQVVVNGTNIRDTKYQVLLGPFGQQVQEPVFSFSENSIAFTFNGNSVEDEYLSYQWRLSGSQETWSIPVAENEVRFADLKPGRYTFEVRVCDTSGNCSELSKPWSFVIRKAPWQQLWFWSLIALLILSISWLIYRRRLLRQRTDAVREKKRLEAELNALTLEQKSLQLQMNPHFIFNALQTVRSRIHEDKLEDARNDLTRFAKLMRVMLEMSRSDKIPLEDELEFLQAYVEVEKMSHHLPVRFNVKIDDDLDVDEIQLSSMLIQPVLENAMKYGGDGKEVKVDMHIKLMNKLLIVAIQDNGTGFGTHTPHHKSAALDIIKNRLAYLGKGGGLEISRSEEGGAVVEMRIPVIT